MKQILILFLSLLSFNAFADSWEDITDKQAKEVKKYLKKYPFILDYCDCCSDSENFLMRVLESDIVPCTYDSEKKSVKVKAIRIAKLDGGPTKISAYNAIGLNDTVDYIISMNYTFVYNSVSIWTIPFFGIIPYRLNTQCDGEASFPNPEYNKDIKDAFYIDWYQKYVKAE
ncbi:MAG: hypothetical protein AB8B74_02435 [Crocinitomicaceae bacterium]